MTWKQLLAANRIKPHKTSKAELDELREAVEVKLKDSASTSISADTRFTTAYGAALLLAKMALACSGYRLKTPGLVEKWRGESAFPKLGFEFKGMKDPDAYLLESGGKAVRIVEFSGKYSASHLYKFHHHCAGQAARWLTTRSHLASRKQLLNLYAPEGTRYELW